MALKLRQNLLLEAFLESRVELFGAWLILLGERFIQDCGAFPGSCVELVPTGRPLFSVSFWRSGNFLRAGAICQAVNDGLGELD